MEALVLAVVVGLGVGVVVGALGAGGGILAVPVLVYLLGQPPHAATASSLVIVGLTAIASLPHHARARNVAWRDGLVFAAISTVGAVLGSRLSALVAPDVLMLLFGGMLTIVAVVMARRALRVRHVEQMVQREPDPEAGAVAATSAGPHRPHLPAVAATATLTGLLTGFFGVGGGFIVVPMLVIAMGLAMRRASGTSLLVMIIATGASLLARIGTPVQVDWALTLVFAAASMAGGVIGGPLSAKARPSTLAFIFAGLLAAVALATLGEGLLAA